MMNYFHDLTVTLRCLGFLSISLEDQATLHFSWHLLFMVFSSSSSSFAFIYFITCYINTDTFTFTHYEPFVGSMNATFDDLRAAPLDRMIETGDVSTVTDTFGPLLPHDVTIILLR